LEVGLWISTKDLLLFLTIATIFLGEELI